MADEMDVVEYSRVAARTTRPATLDKCEWCRGMDYYTLNLDTRKNLQSLHVNLHRFFDKPTTGWLWVPMDFDIMFQFVASYKVNTRKKPTKLYEGRTKFSYRLAATPEMSNRHIPTRPSVETQRPRCIPASLLPLRYAAKLQVQRSPPLRDIQHRVQARTNFWLKRRARQRYAEELLQTP